MVENAVFKCFNSSVNSVSTKYLGFETFKMSISNNSHKWFNGSNGSINIFQV